MGEQTTGSEGRFDFSAKFAAYKRRIQEGLELGIYAESDVIVLLDAFDVLVFPALQRIKQVRWNRGNKF